jgi:hypothetical protein
MIDQSISSKCGINTLLLNVFVFFPHIL